MNAVVVHASLPGGVNDERLAALRDEVVPMVSAAPGFVAGYWLEPDGDDGLSIVVFDSEASAKAAAPPVGTDMGHGVTIKSVEHRAVLGHA